MNNFLVCNGKFFFSNDLYYVFLYISNSFVAIVVFMIFPEMHVASQIPRTIALIPMQLSIKNVRQILLAGFLLLVDQGLVMFVREMSNSVIQINLVWFLK